MSAIRDRLKKRASGLSQKALAALFADERRANRIANVLGRVQQGRQALDEGQAKVLAQLSFASRTDFKDLGKQLSALRRRVRELDEKLKSL